jgi:hypothetical protein
VRLSLLLLTLFLLLLCAAFADAAAPCGCCQGERCVCGPDCPCWTQAPAQAAQARWEWVPQYGAYFDRSRGVWVRYAPGQVVVTPAPPPAVYAAPAAPAYGFVGVNFPAFSLGLRVGGHGHR